MWHHAHHKIPKQIMAEDFHFAVAENRARKREGMPWTCNVIQKRYQFYPKKRVEIRDLHRSRYGSPWRKKMLITFKLASLLLLMPAFSLPVFSFTPTMQNSLTYLFLPSVCLPTKSDVQKIQDCDRIWYKLCMVYRR